MEGHQRLNNHRRESEWQEVQVKKSREFKEGGALLIKNGLYTLIISDLHLVYLPLKTSAPYHSVLGGGARFAIF